MFQSKRFLHQHLGHDRKMTDHIPTDEELEVGFATIPSIEGIQ